MKRLSLPAQVLLVCAVLLIALAAMNGCGRAERWGGDKLKEVTR